MKKYIRANSVQLVLSGSDYFNRLNEMIQSANEIIHLQYYIFDGDDTGNTVKTNLIAAARKGVKIFVLLDAYGSANFPKAYVEEMRVAGIAFRFFSLFSIEGISYGRRLHHKIIVVDKKTALLGGLNISDKYNKNDYAPTWLDFAVLVQGRCCIYLNAVCEGFFNKKKRIILKSAPGNEEHGPLIRFRRNDWLRGKDEIHRSYIKAILNAEKKIMMISSYFLPGYLFQRRLIRAGKRGVRIILILGEKSDIPVFRYAEKYLYNKLINSGVEIYEWNKSVLHGKLMVVDNTWCTIGSYNLNYLSRYSCIEMNVDVCDKQFGTSVTARIEKIMEQCTPVIADSWRKEFNIIKRLKIKIAYYVMRYLLIIIASMWKRSNRHF